MRHDELCELREMVQTPWGFRTGSCQCGSRAFPLCEPCQKGEHLKHRDFNLLLARCACDLCEVAA